MLFPPVIWHNSIVVLCTYLYCTGVAIDRLSSEHNSAGMRWIHTTCPPYEPKGKKYMSTCTKYISLEIHHFKLSLVTYVYIYICVCICMYIYYFVLVD